MGHLTSRLALPRLQNILTAIRDLLEVDEFTGDDKAKDTLEAAGCFEEVDTLAEDLDDINIKKSCHELLFWYLGSTEDESDSLSDTNDDEYDFFAADV